MTYPLPGVIVDPNGVSTSITITSKTSGQTPTVYSDNAGQNVVSMPKTISAPYTFYLPNPGTWTVGGVDVTLGDDEVATVNLNTGTGAYPSPTAKGQKFVSTGTTQTSATWRGEALFYPEDYGAVPATYYSGSGIGLSGGNVLTDTTNAPFQPSDVGKPIFIPGLGQDGSGSALGTTIASYVSPSEVTLTDSGTNYSPAAYYFSHSDSTGPINNAWAAAVQYGGTVVFGPYVYLATQLSNPSAAVDGWVRRSAFMGTLRQSQGNSSPGPNNPVSMLLCCMPVQTTYKAFITAADNGSGGQPQRFGIYDLSIAMSENPSFTAIDASGIRSFEIDGVVVGPFQGASGVGSSHTNACGVRFPGVSNYDLSRAGSLQVSGFYTSVEANTEHFTADDLVTTYCQIGLAPTGANGWHGMSILKWSVEKCAYAIAPWTPGTGLGSFSSSVYLSVNLMDLEEDTGINTDIYDPNSNLRGEIKFLRSSTSSSGVIPGLSLNGATKVRLFDLSVAAGAYTPTLPASGTASTPLYRDQMIVVTGGTVSAIAVGGTTLGVTSGPIFVPSGQTFTITYSAAPTLAGFVC